MGVRCGIDLGTTFSSISWYDSFNNRVETIDLEAADGLKTMRSVVYYPGSNEAPVVGQTAYNAWRNNPERGIVGIKRAMGTAFKTAPMDGVEYTPQQVSAEILKVLAHDAQVFLGEEVKDVVITVPAYFGDNERAATLEAGRLAGLNVLGLLPEPHAAALAYAIEKAATIKDKYLLVYDLGGGTFDVTLIHARGGIDPDHPTFPAIDTLCKDGNAQRGGLDWDRALAEIVAEKVMQQSGIDVMQDPKNEGVLLDNCEKAKRDLSRINNVSIVADLASHQVDVSVDEFENRTRALLLETQMLLEKVLADAEKMKDEKTGQAITRDQIDVLLSGGAARMPMVRKMIESVMGKPPLQHRNPELLVTIGAAYYAHLLEEGGPLPIDESRYSVGVEVLRPDDQGRFINRFYKVILPMGTKFGSPAVKMTFGTSEDNQTEVTITIYHGEVEDLTQCVKLAEFTITGLPAGRPKGQPVELELGYDVNGILQGKAKDVSTGKEVEIRVERTFG